ncbi:HAD family hydrolase [Demequina sp.]|uniref:HAD family hydrolase n=1 Tax=Demequina sp. TaxID=2050685 RepID=UPI003D129012
MAHALTPPAGLRLVALDIDDTLIPWRGTLARETVDAIRTVRAAGIEVVLASGRSVRSVLPVALELGIDEAWALCSNGAITVRIAGGEAAEHGRRTFDPRGIMAAIRELDPLAPAAVEMSGLSFMYDGDPYAFEQLPVSQAADFPEAVAFLSVSSRVIDAATFAAITAAHPVHSVPYPHEEWASIDVVSSDAGKGAALAALAAAHGFAPHECAAVGDYLNDIPMLEWAGWAVAMGQAPPEVRAVADAVVARVEDHGAAQALLAIAAASS